MRKLTKQEIKSEAKKIFDSWIARYSLKNAKKIVLEVRRQLLSEENRRKDLRG